MKIFVAGASGRVGKDLTQDLIKAGHKVIAGSRHPKDDLKNDAVAPVKMDLHASVKELTQLVGQVDAIYFTAGSRGKDLLQTDAFGAVKLMQVAKKNGVQRFVMLSSMYALEPDKWAQTPGLADIPDYNIAKFFADNYLVNQSGLDYTIIQPTGLDERKGSGKIALNDGENQSIAIPDVALTLAQVLDHENTIGKVVKIQGGQTPVDDVLAKIK